MEVTNVCLVLLATVKASDNENLTEETAKARADAFLVGVGEVANWDYRGVEWHNYDHVTVVYTSKPEEADDDA